VMSYAGVWFRFAAVSMSTALEAGTIARVYAEFVRPSHTVRLVSHHHGATSSD
jgi:hypothetical protein